MTDLSELTDCCCSVNSPEPRDHHLNDIKSITTRLKIVSLASHGYQTKQNKQNEGTTWTDGGLSPSPLAP